MWTGRASTTRQHIAQLHAMVAEKEAPFVLFLFASVCCIFVIEAGDMDYFTVTSWS